MKVSKITIAAVVSMFAIVLYSSDAEARRRHRHHKHRHHHYHRVALPEPTAPSFFSPSRGSAMLAEAERWIGSKNPTGFRGPWCGAFQAMVARKAGVEPPNGYLMAKSWVHAGRRINGPAVGAIAVITRRGGGHVGIVSGVDADGDPIVVSGNHHKRVGVGVYPKSRVLAYVEP